MGAASMTLALAQSHAHWSNECILMTVASFRRMMYSRRAPETGQNAGYVYLPVMLSASLVRDSTKNTYTCLLIMVTYDALQLCRYPRT